MKLNMSMQNFDDHKVKFYYKLILGLLEQI